MPRIAWSRLAILLFALPIVSCIGDETTECPTCPPENSARLAISVTQTGLVDSVHITLDGGARVTVKRNVRFVFESLARGDHAVHTVRWFSSEGVPFPRSEDFTIRLERGETRTIVFQNDFPLISWAPRPAVPHTVARRAGGFDPVG